MFVNIDSHFHSDQYMCIYQKLWKSVDTFLAKFGSNPVSNFRGKDFVYHWQQKPSDANRGSEKLKTIEKLNWVGLKLNMECEEKLKKLGQYVYLKYQL